MAGKPLLSTQLLAIGVVVVASSSSLLLFLL